MTTPAKKRPSAWLSEHFAALLEGLADEPAGRRRLVDFTVVHGRVSGKVLEEGARPVRVEFAFPELSDAAWDAVLEELARDALFSAALLAAEIPPEVDEAFRRCGFELVPPNRSALKIQCECRSASCRHAALLRDRFLARLEEDPFSVFVLRGRGMEETLADLRRLRKRPVEAAVTEPPPLAATAGEFYCTAPELWELSYNIRADELPAALLKRLDVLPLATAAGADAALEEAYVYVARRAQAFGLGMRRSG